MSELKHGNDLVIISTGTMVHKALMVANELNSHSVSTGLVDLYRIKPLNIEKLFNIIGNYRRIITLEENSIVGGIGSIISEVLNDYQKYTPLKRMAIPDQHCFEAGDREDLHEIYGLDIKSNVGNILNGFK
ncbi:MAG: transketolase C-terminal domain-containing protein [Candidatus Omnitrophota bacterium]